MIDLPTTFAVPTPPFAATPPWGDCTPGEQDRRKSGGRTQCTSRRANDRGADAGAGRASNDARAIQA
ncbi:hypothetical protein ACCO45_009514 [Purpureocillium lilacinum]|uniref:Uncharacterized protein n=1 Tax=Purpureocillium lilacinum TaxID=33203 RepID=A0ACC4DKN9_PURLI